MKGISLRRMASLSQPIYELRKTIRFEAAHRLPHLPIDHKCSRLHGHSYSATLVLRGVLDEKMGWIIDTGEIKKIAKPIFDLLDHRYLNEIQGLENPTSEIIAAWIYEKLASLLPQLAQVIVAETCTTEARYPVKE